MPTRRRRRVAGLALATALLGGGFAAMTRSAAQSVCRGECDEAFRACQRGCAMAQSFDNCVTECRRQYDQCVDACQ
jgi:hypothetical protein